VGRHQCSCEHCHMLAHGHMQTDASAQPSAAAASKVPGHTAGVPPHQQCCPRYQRSSVPMHVHVVCRWTLQQLPPSWLSRTLQHPADPSIQHSSMSKPSGHPSSHQHSLQCHVYPPLACHVLHLGTWPWPSYKSGISAGMQIWRSGDLEVWRSGSGPASHLQTRTVTDAQCAASLMMR
jgi:hypothetical protein